MKINDHKLERNKEILSRYRNGETKSSIARKFGISATRIGNVIAEMQLIEKSTDPFKGLSTRTRNGLKSANLMTIGQVIYAVQSGFFNRRVTNIGKVGRDELFQWVRQTDPSGLLISICDEDLRLLLKQNLSSWP